MDSECGSIGFQLSNEALSGELVEVTADGVVTFQTVTSVSWLGEHLVSFQIYLKDLDPSAIFNWSLDLSLKLKI